MGNTVRRQTDTAVVLICHGCGRPIVLTATDTGAELQDAPEFLRIHASCLARVADDELRIELPD